MKPIVIINFKTYKAGKEELKLAKEVEKVNRNIIVGVQASSISQITKNTKLIVFAQHVDPYEQGRNTGFILPESVKGAGAQGTFLNHSEHKLDLETIDKTIKRCKK